MLTSDDATVHDCSAPIAYVPIALTYLLLIMTSSEFVPLAFDTGIDSVIAATCPAVNVILEVQPALTSIIVGIGLVS